MHKKAFLVACGVLSALSLVLMIALVAVHLPSFGMWFYYWQYGLNDTYAQVQMHPEHLHEVTRHMIAYMQGKVPDLQIYSYVDGIFRPFFSDIEIRHMVDVKDLAVISIWVRNIAFVLFFVTLLPFVFLKTKAKKAWRILFKSWRNGAVVTFALLAALTIVIAIDWQQAWVIFHEIIFSNEMFFGNEYWLLNPNVDLLINIVPYPFFVAISAFIAAFFALGLVVMFVAGLLLSRKKRRGKILGQALMAGTVAILLIASFRWALITFNVIGYVLFAIILFATLIFLLAFFAKFRYDIKVDKAGLDAPWKYLARITWLAGIVKLSFSDEDGLKFTVFGRKINLDKNQAPVAEEAEKVRETRLLEQHPLDEDSAKKLKKARTASAAKQKRRKAKEKKDKSNSIKRLVNEIGKDNIWAAFKLALGLLKDFFILLKPKQLRIRGKFGLEEPDQTGLAMAAVSGIETLGLDIYLTGDFEEKTLELDIFAKGGFRLWQFLNLLIKFWLAPEIQRVYRLTSRFNKAQKRKV